MQNWSSESVKKVFDYKSLLLNEKIFSGMSTLNIVLLVVLSQSPIYNSNISLRNNFKH